ncbi:S23-interacting protein [Branchiostoma belcheri]|nr:S23-interacting protein [Branchiostoma belcheri]
MLTLVILIAILNVPYAGISQASGEEMNVTTQAGNKKDCLELHNLTLRNDSAGICDILSATNSSEVRQNISSIQNDSSRHSSYAERRASAAPMHVTVCLGVWTVVTNSLPLAAIIKHEQLHTPAYILMANLAASDVLTGVAFVFGGVSVLVDIYTESIDIVVDVWSTRLRFTSLLFSGLSSAYGLLALTVERYWFIVHGMTYVNNVTNDKCKVVIAIGWLWSVLLAMSPNFGWHCAGVEEGCLPFIGGGLAYSYVAVVLMFMFIIMTAIFLLNAGVFWCLWKHMNAIAAQEAAVGSPPSFDRKSALTVVIITVVFLVGWLPFTVRMALLIKDDRLLAPLMVFIILNSAANPVVYGFRLAEVRRGVARLFVNSSGNAGLA